MEEKRKIRIGKKERVDRSDMRWKGNGGNREG